MAYKLDILIGTDLDKNELKKTEQQLDALYKKYSSKRKISLGFDEEKNAKNIQKLSDKLDGLNNRTKKASKSTSGFVKNMKTAVTRTIEWTVAVGGLYSVINKLKDSVGFTADFDRSLTEIAMVTGQTRDQVDGLKDSYIELGEELKVSSLELANSAVALYRQGLSLQEVNDRLSEISKTAKVAGLSVEQVTKFVTSGTNAMKVSAQEFNDVLLKVSSIAATDYQNIGEALQKSATGFTSAGFSLERSASIIATIQEVTQEASQSIGTSMKTILARFNKLTDTGEDNTKTLNDIDKALQTVGLSLRGLDGQLRPTAEVLDEVAGVWDGLTKNQQAYLGSTIAGVRQIERFRVLMENYGRSIEITNQAYSAAGTTQEQYLKFQESIEGKLGDLTVTWEKFYDTLVDEGTIQEFLDFMIGIVEVLTSLEKNIGLVNIATVAFAGYMTGKFVPAMILGAGAATALQTALIGIGGAVVVAGILGIAKAIDHFTTSTEELDDNIKNLTNDLEGFNKNLSTYDELAKKFDELKNVTSLTKEQQEEFISTQNQLAEILPQMVLYYDENGNAVLDLSADYDTLTESIKATQREMEKELETENVEKISRVYEDLERKLEVIEKLRSRGENLGKTDEQLGLTAYVDDVKKLKTELLKIGTSLQQTSGEFQNLTDSQKAYAISQLESKIASAETKEEILDLTDAIQYNATFTKELMEGYVDYSLRAGEAKRQQDLLNTSMISSGEIAKYLDSDVKSLSDALKELSDTGEISDETFISLAQNQEAVRFALNATKSELENLGLQYGYTAEDIADIQSQLTNIVLNNSRKRIVAMLTEYQALQDMASSAPTMEEQYALYGLGRAVGEEAMRAQEYINRLDDIDGYFKEVKTSTSKATKETKKYVSVITELTKLQDDLALAQAKQDTARTLEQEISFRKQEITILGNMKSEIHDILATQNEQLETLQEGAQEYEDLYKLRNDNELELYRLDKEIQSTKQENLDLINQQNSALEDQRSIMSEIRDNISSMWDEFDQDMTLEEVAKRLYDITTELNSLDENTIEGLERKQELVEEQTNLLKEYDRLLEKEATIYAELVELQDLRNELAIEKARLDSKGIEDTSSLIPIYRRIQDELNRQLSIQESIRDSEVEGSVEQQEAKNKIADYAEEILSIDAQILGIETAITDALDEQAKKREDALEKAKSGLKEYADYQKSVHEENVKNIEEEIESTLDEFDKFKENLETQLDDIKEKRKESIKEEWDSVKQLREEEENRKELSEKLLKLQKAQKKLSDAQKERTQKVFTGEAFEFMADPSKIKDAQDALKDATDDLNEFKLEEQQKLEDESFQQRLDAVDDETDAVVKRTKDMYNKLLVAERNKVNKTIQNLRIEKQNNLNTIEAIETEWEDAYNEQITSIEELKSYIEGLGLTWNDYIATLDKALAKTLQLNNAMGATSGGSGSSGSSSAGGSSGTSGTGSSSTSGSTSSTLTGAGGLTTPTISPSTSGETSDSELDNYTGNTVDGVYLGEGVGYWKDLYKAENEKRKEYGWSIPSFSDWVKSKDTGDSTEYANTTVRVRNKETGQTYSVPKDYINEAQWQDPKFEVYHNGIKNGLVGGKGLKSDEVMVKALAGEAFFTQEQLRNIIPNALMAVNNIPNIEPIKSNNSSGDTVIQIDNISLPEVTDTDTFIKSMNNIRRQYNVTRR